MKRLNHYGVLIGYLPRVVQVQPFIVQVQPRVVQVQPRVVQVQPFIVQVQPRVVQVYRHIWGYIYPAPGTARHNRPVN